MFETRINIYRFDHGRTRRDATLGLCSVLRKSLLDACSLQVKATSTSGIAAVLKSHFRCPSKRTSPLCGGYGAPFATLRTGAGCLRQSTSFSAGTRKHRHRCVPGLCVSRESCLTPTSTFLPGGAGDSWHSWQCPRSHPWHLRRAPRCSPSSLSLSFSS